MFLIDFPTFSDYNNQPVKFLQPKFDGHLLKIHKHTELTALSKNDKLLTDKVLSCPTVAKALSKVPSHSILFGEIYHAGRATEIPTLLNSGSKKLQIQFFAAPIYATRNSWHEDLCSLAARLIDDGLPFVETRDIENVIASLHTEADWQEFKDSLLKDALDNTMEGWVLKRAHMNDWYKLKPVKTLDAVVMSVLKSYSALNFGDIQSYVVGVYANGRMRIIANVGTGLSMEDRKVDPASLIGKVCEIGYDCLAGNRLRFPRFLRWRDDKDPQDCQWSQVC